GRPIRLPNTFPTVEGTKVYPSVPGGTNWFSPTYSPQTDLFYVATREQGGIFYMGEADYKPGRRFDAGGFRSIPGEERYGAVRALKPATGEMVWEFRLFTPPWAGLLSTAGGLVFGGAAEGDVFALDAATGQSLWRFQTGGEAHANPISYLSEGKQHVAVAMGNSIFDFALEE
ncbi:MAG: PQQ-binding-like beta-propeller repeat protein, partial [Acidobacteria bacterium]|nr:PQQ-binding-like beta-propeller repeat protein [Acidobacteriota bacterium]